MILLAVDSFGREFSLGTFSSLMAQPVERGQIWRTKIFVLLAAAGLILAAYFASCELRLHLALADGRSLWHVNPGVIGGDFSHAMSGSVAVLFVALTGGLWTALLIRQVAAAFWITSLAPAGLLALAIFGLSFLAQSPSAAAVARIVCGRAAVYVVLAVLARPPPMVVGAFGRTARSSRRKSQRFNRPCSGRPPARNCWPIFLRRTKGGNAKAPAHDSKGLHSCHSWDSWAPFSPIFSLRPRALATLR